MTELLVILLMLAINACLAAFEMALASTPLSRIHAHVREGRRGARLALRMKERLEGSLAVVQLGITLSAAIAAATGGVELDKELRPWLEQRWGLSASSSEALSVAMLVLPLSALTILFAELMPKMIALTKPDQVLLLFSPVMWGLSVVFRPFVALFERSVRGLLRLVRIDTGAEPTPDDRDGVREILAAAAFARASRHIGPLEEKIVSGAAALSGRHLRDVMVPAEDICAIPGTFSLGESLVSAHLNLHTRFPICRDAASPLDLTGYINFKDIVAALKTNEAGRTVADIQRPLLDLQAGAAASDALDRLIREKEHIAAVRDGPTVVGLVTLADLMALLTGRIEDEYDRLPSHFHATPAGCIAGGGVSMTRVFEWAGRPAVHPGAAPAPETVDAWYARTSGGRAPAGGDQVTADGLEVRVRKVRRQRLAEASIRRV